MSDYRPVDCAIYGRYEVAILKRQRLNLRWQDADGITHFGLCRPIDLETCKGAEFLHAAGPDGCVLRIRLDRIVASKIAG